MKLPGAVSFIDSFHPETKLRVFDKNSSESVEVTAEDIAADRDRYQLYYSKFEDGVPLLEFSSIDAKPSTQFSFFYEPSGWEVTRFKVDKMMISIQTGEKTLRVTSDHEVILASGEAVLASSLEPDSELLSCDGKPLSITSISKDHYQDWVYDFYISPRTDELPKVLCAEGVAVYEWRPKVREYQMGFF